MREFLPHLQSSHRDEIDGELTISPNMLTLWTTREAMVLYKALFRAILTKRSVRDLDIEMVGVLPSLVGAMGVVAEEVPKRAFARLTIRLGNKVTFKRGKSLHWEVYGHPFCAIVNFSKGTLSMGQVVLALPL